MRVRNGWGDRGGFTWVTALLLLIVGGGIYTTYALAPSYVADWKWRREINGQLIKASELNDQEIRQNLMKHAEMLHIPVSSGEGTFNIMRHANNVEVEYEYEVPVPMPGVEKLKFKDKVSREVTEVKHLFHQPAEPN
ncbi:hypothetical protein K8I61_00690 [bacterium]|nr:hypothetical protein [bacterium]